MASFRFKVMAGTLLGLLLAIVVTALLARHREAPPVAEPHVIASPEPPAPAPAAPAPPASRSPASRSKGQSDWAFFFRAGDTLSRMADAAPLGVVARLERSHAFPDGSVGPAYVIRSADQRETVFDADELERSARVETTREIAPPPIGTRPK